MSRLSKQCGILNTSQPYRPPRPVYGIALLYLLTLWKYMRGNAVPGRFLGLETKGRAGCIPWHQVPFRSLMPINRGGGGRHFPVCPLIGPADHGQSNAEDIQILHFSLIYSNLPRAIRISPSLKLSGITHYTLIYISFRTVSKLYHKRD
jgi:hypothetical protein